MPPIKSKTTEMSGIKQVSKLGDQNSASAEEVDDERLFVENQNEEDDNAKKALDKDAKGYKRKKRMTSEQPNKAQKTEEDSASTTHQATSVQVLKFLLSNAAIDCCRPDDEIKDVQERGKKTNTYSQLLSPFEELLCAIILSRPISHRLGLRTIRTILNKPYSFHTPEAIKAAGSEEVHQSLWDARTQHKDKTADEIELIAAAVTDNDWANDLGRLRERSHESVEEEREVLRKSVKGLGKTGLDIFYRRVQWKWKEAFPFLDQRTKESVVKLGLPGEASGLVKAIDQHWSQLGYSETGHFDEEELKRRAFVIVLERAVGADLEKKTERILEEAVKP